jgi:hypothetical protein
MGGYSCYSDLWIPDCLVLHDRTPRAFCRIPRRGNPLRSRVASRDSAAKNFQTDPFPLNLKNMNKNIWRAVIEVGFIIFLFYSNLLMGEFERSGMGEKRGLAWAMADVFTSLNFVIALIAALVGYVLFEFLRKRF